MRLNCNENRENNLKWSDLIVSYLLLLSNIIALDKELFIVKQVEQRRLFFSLETYRTFFYCCCKRRNKKAIVGSEAIA